jgi:hypothetical protein
MKNTQKKIFSKGYVISLIIVSIVLTFLIFFNYGFQDINDGFRADTYVPAVGVVMLLCVLARVAYVHFIIPMLNGLGDTDDVNRLQSYAMMGAAGRAALTNRDFRMREVHTSIGGSGGMEGYVLNSLKKDIDCAKYQEKVKRGIRKSSGSDPRLR